MQEISEPRNPLEEAISRHVMMGGVIISQNPREAVISYAGKPVNHTLHAILTIFTCLIWGIVWAVMAANQKKERRVRITLLSDGAIREEQLVLHGA